ncbi:sulfite exporter TauE/SafE family protein 2-like isoform X2 [Henckelia pumila]|uniref:sulfite exporter TauE/SafE family protein 2-like isoform X2 n=1 Tax=Henckelia pumila TaxID=405737 RepID=UPI003C6E2C74
MKQKFLKSLLFLIFSSIIFDIIHAKQTEPAAVSVAPFSYQTRNYSTHRWRDPLQLLDDTNMKPSFPFLVAGLLSFLASAISSAGGIGGGGLYIPILTIVACLDLKTASGFSAFMVTGGSVANVVCYMFPGIHKQGAGKKTLIDYDVALLSQPCVLLGVSCGVICNVVFPEWLITICLVIFLSFCTYKTFKSGVSYWKRETELLERGNNNAWRKMESAGEAFDQSDDKVPLLGGKQNQYEPRESCWSNPLMKLGMLIIIWFAFFVLYLLRGNRYGQGIINIEACGKAYWLISSIQIPLACIFTAWILYSGKILVNKAPTPNVRSKHMHMLPIMALSVGFLGGLFGIGGGMLISPLLLQIGLAPEVTAATCSFMVFFSSSMSAMQYLLLGMKQVYGALIYSAICLVGSLVGLIIVQRAITKYGRASIVVFSVGIVLALSTILITGYGAVDIWEDITTGQSLGFKKPC